jgi:hypothetical protein
LHTTCTTAAAAAGEYDVKFTDIINAAEILLVSSTAVKSETTLESLGEAQALGAKLAKGRKLDLINVRDRKTEVSRGPTQLPPP